EISGVPPCCPARDVTLRDRSGEAVCVSDHPVGKQSATTAAGYAEFLRVDIAAFDHLVDTDHEVAKIVPGIVILNNIAEVLTVRGTATRIGVKDHVALCGHPLKFVIEDPSVGGVRTTVDVEDQRILLRRVEVRRLLNPRMDFLAVEARVPDL